MKTLPSYDLETTHGAKCGGLVAGVDEVGRGPLAGPVVAAAVILDPKNIPEGLNDSKSLSEKRREALSPIICETAQFGIGIASVEEIDTLNILQASLVAMARAVEALPRAPALCLVDGNHPPKLSCDTLCVIKGDAKSLSIMRISHCKLAHQLIALCLCDD